MGNTMFDINNAITVQPGSVVSRELLKDSGGNVTLFAFDKGEGLSDHQTPFSVLVMVIEGSISFTAHETTHLMAANSALLLSPSTPHSLTANSPSKLMLVMIKNA
jgi:quercetin dioxygenase-like cupin family protein